MSEQSQDSAPESTPHVDDLDDLTPTERSRTWFWGGVFLAVALGALGFVWIHNTEGGTLWWLTFLLPVALFGRAITLHRRGMAEGEAMLSRSELIATIIGVVITLGSVLLYWSAYVSWNHRLEANVGSCWALGRTSTEKVLLVDCGESRAIYIAVSSVPTGTQDSTCPKDAVASVVGDRPSVTLCLAKR